MIRRIEENKKRYLDLLLLADEQEDMIDRYLTRGEMFVLMQNGEALAVCVVTREEGYKEIKNLAVRPDVQKTGLGREMIRYVEQNVFREGDVLMVGTGDSPLTMPFYEKCGFSRHHVVKDFFTQNYDHEIWEEGVLLRDMVYLSKTI